MPRIKAPYKLSDKSIRMSWNKYNLYNHQATSRQTLTTGKQKLFGQQQGAKRITRKYHGQGLPERVFKKQLYSSRFNVVAGGSESKPRLLWSGLYHGVERRLDTVIFRSLFATSIQQARQMVIHGHVEVNGKKESRPGLLLRPGDIYHTNPQLVRKFISSHFHEKHQRMMEGRRRQMMERRVSALAKRGQKLEDVLPKLPPLSHLYEYNPYLPILGQGTHPIFRNLDDQARREEAQYQKARFIPKPFMAPNVFLPAYLEVSYRSCTGCFVRLPHIKNDGLMEIPSPFTADIHERAGMFYVSHGRLANRQSGFRGYKLYRHNKKIRR